MPLKTCVILLAAFIPESLSCPSSVKTENLGGNESQSIELAAFVLKMINASSTLKFSLKTAMPPNASVEGLVTYSLYRC